MFSCRCHSSSWCCSKALLERCSRYQSILKHCTCMRVEHSLFDKSLSVVGDHEVEWCGLQNMGNSCYMNAGLQCVCSLPHFAVYFFGMLMYRHPLYTVAICLLIFKETCRWLVIQSNVRVRENQCTVSKEIKRKLNVVFSSTAVSEYCWGSFGVDSFHHYIQKHLRCHLV